MCVCVLLIFGYFGALNQNPIDSTSPNHEHFEENEIDQDGYHKT